MVCFRWQRSKSGLLYSQFLDPRTFILDSISFGANSLREFKSGASRLEEIGKTARESWAQIALDANPIKHLAQDIDAMDFG
jgi:hypothetical protein